MTGRRTLDGATILTRQSRPQLRQAPQYPDYRSHHPIKRLRRNYEIDHLELIAHRSHLQWDHHSTTRHVGFEMATRKQHELIAKPASVSMSLLIRVLNIEHQALVRGKIKVNDD